LLQPSTKCCHRVCPIVTLYAGVVLPLIELPLVVSAVRTSGGPARLRRRCSSSVGVAWRRCTVALGLLL